HRSDHTYFLFIDLSTTLLYTLSLHDALPISPGRDMMLKALSGMARYLHANAVPPSKVKPDGSIEDSKSPVGFSAALLPYLSALGDRKSTRLNSSHVSISYAVFCLKKKKKQ